MTIIKGSDGSGSMAEPGIYRVKVTSVEDAPSNDYGPQLKFVFTVIDQDGDDTDQQIFGWCSPKFHPKSTLYAWSKAILRSKCPTPPDDIDTKSLIGKKCDLEYVEYTKTKGVNAGQKGTKIGSLYPFGTMSSDEDAA